MRRPQNQCSSSASATPPRSRLQPFRIAAVRLLAVSAALLVCFTPARSAFAQSAAPRVIALFPEKDLYRQAADALAEAQRKRGVSFELIALPEGDADAQSRAIAALREKKPTLIVTGGSTLTADVLREVPGVPVVFFMVPNAADAPFLQDASPDRQRVAGVSCDVAPALQIDWALRVNGKTKRLAVFCSPRTARTVAALVTAGQARGISIEPIEARADNIADATDTASKHADDGVLMIPDAQVYNNASIQHLLVWGIREKRAVFAFSEKIVKAGALAGILTNPADVGRRTAELVNQISAGKSPAEIGVVYCDQSRRALNTHTASFISAPLDEAQRDKDVVVFGDAP